MEFRKVFDRTMQCIERPGDEITFLKRHHVLHPDGRLTIYTHHKHVLQLYSLLGLNAENQTKKSPAPADIDLEDKSENPPSSDATTLRWDFDGALVSAQNFVGSVTCLSFSMAMSFFFVELLF